MKPKFIIHKSKIYEQLKLLESIFHQVSYSWKTNPKVGEILNEKEDCYMSIHSINELDQVKNKNKIWFFLFATNEEKIDKLFTEYKLNNFVVDNTEDLKILTNYINKNKKKINLLLRMKLRENTIFTGKHHVFGMRLSDIKESLDTLHNNKNIEKLGIHVHRKTQNVSEWNLKDEIFHSLGEEYLSKIQLLNLGGGLPGKYENSHDNEIETIFNKIKELKELTNKYKIKLIIEPGRFIASPAVDLKCQIIAIHENTCYLNVSVFNGMMDTIVANVKLIVQEESNKNDGNPYVLKGSTPDSADILRYRVYLTNPKTGDTLTFKNCGAYTYSSNFCSLDKINYEIIK